MCIFQNPPVTAPERAYQWLRKEISKLPWDQEAFLSENSIADAAEVSRTPVREALLRLEAEGLLRRIPHKGVYIPAMNESDIDEIMEVRQVIGEWASRKVAESQPAIFDSLRELLAKQRRHIEDPTKFIELDVAFHRTIVLAAANPVLAQVYESQRVKQERVGIQAVLATAERYQHVIEEHGTLIEAMASGDPQRATAAARNHIHSTRSAISSRSIL